MKRTVIALLSAPVLVSFLCMTALSGNVQAESANAEYEVGICQFSDHEALNKATEGFKTALGDALGDTVSFNEQNAGGNYDDCVRIINDFTTREADLILANATASLLAAGNATVDIPIIGTAVTDYSEFERNNISGTSDFVPAKEQAQVIQELFPDAAKVGLIYCSSENASLYQVNAVDTELAACGYDCELYSFIDSSDLSDVTAAAAAECDILYLPTDNLIADNAELIANICTSAHIPVFTSDENTCRVCGAATLTADYYELGYASGEMAVQVLRGEADISELPVQTADNFVRLYNENICQSLDIQVPEGFVALSE